jgi:DNA adenine methylase
MVSNVSPLRYPGGKTRACKKLELILLDNFDLNSVNTIVSPFFGGGSFEFFLQNKYGFNIIANDKFEPLANFWKVCKSVCKEELCTKLSNEKEQTISKETFLEYRKKIVETDSLMKAVYFFVINRCSFSGATLSGGFSRESSEKRFTHSSITRIKKLDLDNFEINCKDFSCFIGEIENDKLMFVDPPYFLQKGSKLYGNKGDLHEDFDHLKLYNIMSSKNRWILTYNNCDFIKNLYKDYKIIETNWSYGMNKTKKSSEIVILKT